MKEKIYTIPLNEAFDEDGECPFCSLFYTLEKNAVNYTLGPSYMEPDSRIVTNEKGFCKEHYTMMYNEKNRLGLALMVSSHYDKILSEYDEWYKFSEKPKRGLFKKKVEEKSPASELEKSCFICEKVNSEMDKFYDTFVYLWKREEDFRKKVILSKGFCLNHFDKVVMLAKEKLSQKDFDEFFKVLYEKQKDELKRVEDELDWFIKKFDYRFKDEPWGNSRTALRRSIVKISSLDVQPEEK